MARRIPVFISIAPIPILLEPDKLKSAAWSENATVNPTANRVKNMDRYRELTLQTPTFRFVSVSATFYGLSHGPFSAISSRKSPRYLSCENNSGTMF